MDTPILSCEELSKSYGTTPVLQGLSLSLMGNETVGLLSPSGGGKTTFIKLIAGLLVPTSGMVKIGGFSPSAETRGMIAYLPDRCALPPQMNTGELVRFYERMFSDFDADKARRLLKELRVNTVKRIKTLSKGTKEKVQLILTMCRQARLYLLDEPFRDTSPITRDYVLTTILSARAEGSAVLIATQTPAAIDGHMDSFLFLKDGRLIGYEASDAETLEQAFGRFFSC